MRTPVFAAVVAAAVYALQRRRRGAVRRPHPQPTAVAATAAGARVCVVGGRQRRPSGGGVALLVHGGAWDIPHTETKAHMDGMRDVLLRGRRMLLRGCAAADVVAAVVAGMEACGVFDAGCGAVLTRDGTVELDAGVMDGATAQFGSVAGMRRCVHPVTTALALARGAGNARFLAGRAADDAAAAIGLPMVANRALVCDRERRRRRRLRAAARYHTSSAFLPPAAPRGTVGCVARDADGRLAAATSTGGTPLRPSGRVGDSPLPGAGFFATTAGAVSSTGWGEAIAAANSAASICRGLETVPVGPAVGGECVEDVARREVHRLASLVHNAADGRPATGGFIAMHASGEAGFAFSTPRMARVVVRTMASRGDDGFPTHTSRQQLECEDDVIETFVPPEELPKTHRAVLFNAADEPVLVRERHLIYLRRGYELLNGGFVCLDASRTWVVYWITHSMDLLGATPLPFDVATRVVDFLGRCQHPHGGFGGGPQQLAHCAPTYSAVLALTVVGTPEAYAVVNRASLYAFFMRMKHSSGGFRMHEHGEIDVRATYTVVAVAKLLNLCTPELMHGVVDYVLSCQTYEGGFGGEPGNEAHGGYAFCGAAALVLLGAIHRANIPALTDWLVARQMHVEGGFQGRTNKLVDGCYSFWQGAVFALLPEAAATAPPAVPPTPPPPTAAASGSGAGTAPATTGSAEGGATDADDGVNDDGDDDTTPATTGSAEGGATDASTAGDDGVNDDGDDDTMLLDRVALQRYILRACQHVAGGLKDKPSKSRDYYHTCYCLSGLSIAQHDARGNVVKVLGDPRNEVKAVHPAFNISLGKAAAAVAHFMVQPCPPTTTSPPVAAAATLATTSPPAPAVDAALVVELPE